MTQVSPDTAAVEMSVDYRLAPIPDRAYYADYSNVQQSRFGLTLSFGKLASDQRALRTKIEVVFPETMFQKQLLGSTAGLRRTLEQLLGDKKLPKIPGLNEETEKTQTFRSNNVFMAIWGEEGVLDFYYISPRDYFLSHAEQGAEVGLEPVVRVVLDAALMKEFLDTCQLFAGEGVDLTEQTSEAGVQR